MTTELVIMQGDQYAIPIEILTADGTPANGDTFADVEIVVGSLRKTMSSGAVVYDASRGAFLFPLTQAETFAMRDLPQQAQIRVKTTTGDVIGLKLGDITIDASRSKEIL